MYYTREGREEGGDTSKYTREERTIREKKDSTQEGREKRDDIRGKN